jgi:N-acetylmuramoyl-L-alanine amidase
MPLKVILLTLMILMSPLASSMVPMDDLKCLTDNLYHEARGESPIGIVKVGMVTLNRVKDSRWPTTVCKVVYQRRQFSWTAGEVLPIKNITLYKELERISYVLLLTNNILDREGSNHYLRCDWKDKVNWWVSMDFKGSIGNHCFYKG